MIVERFETVTDALDHIIPEDKLDKRQTELDEVKGLLRVHQDVILTAESSGHGKSTFGKILRADINNNSRAGSYPGCIFTDVSLLTLKFGERSDRSLGGLDIVTYRQLLAFKGLVIFDEVFPEHVPLVRTLQRSKHLMMVQPSFLEGPPYDDILHADFDRWLNETQPPIYRLPHYNAGQTPVK